jgi:hypothetical protein
MSSNIIKLNIHKVTSTDAEVTWELHHCFNVYDIVKFHLQLFKDGRFESYEQLSQVGKSKKPIFEDNDIEAGEQADPNQGYRLNGLEAATVYRVEVTMHI